MTTTTITPGDGWLEGSQPWYTLTFTDDAGDAANPTALSVTIRQPDGTATSYTTSDDELANTGTGAYVFIWQTAVTAAQAGQWVMIVTATLDGKARATEFVFRVEQRADSL